MPVRAVRRRAAGRCRAQGGGGDAHDGAGQGQGQGQGADRVPQTVGEDDDTQGECGVARGQGREADDGDQGVCEDVEAAAEGAFGKAKGAAASTSCIRISNSNWSRRSRSAPKAACRCACTGARQTVESDRAQSTCARRWGPGRTERLRPTGRVGRQSGPWLGRAQLARPSLVAWHRGPRWWQS